METMAAKTKDGTFILAIERNKGGDVGVLDLHLSLIPDDETDWIRDIVAKLSEVLGGAGERYLMARLGALVDELEQQDEGRRIPSGPQAAGTGAPSPVRGDRKAAPGQAFDVILEDAGDREIHVLKAVRAVTKMSLQEARELVDGVPATVVESISKQAAEKIRRTFTEAGAKVRIE